jgi:hypothetical protein
VAAKLGVSATLAKPYDPDGFVALIAKVLAGPEPKPRPSS